MIGVLVDCFFASGFDYVCGFPFVDTLTKIVEVGMQFVVAHRFLLGASE
ncbi:hypothetical protein [Natronococcus wangiae]|nr:hypothetical protein [Natronococcus sp. AD5]